MNTLTVVYFKACISWFWLQSISGEFCDFVTQTLFSFRYWAEQEKEVPRHQTMSSLLKQQFPHVLKPLIPFDKPWSQSFQNQSHPPEILKIETPREDNQSQNSSKTVGQIKDEDLEGSSGAEKVAEKDEATELKSGVIIAKEEASMIIENENGHIPGLELHYLQHTQSRDLQSNQNLGVDNCQEEKREVGNKGERKALSEIDKDDHEGIKGNAVGKCQGSNRKNLRERSAERSNSEIARDEGEIEKLNSSKEILSRSSSKEVKEIRDLSPSSSSSFELERSAENLVLSEPSNSRGNGHSQSRNDLNSSLCPSSFENSDFGQDACKSEGKEFWKGSESIPNTNSDCSNLQSTLCATRKSNPSWNLYSRPGSAAKFSRPKTAKKETLGSAENEIRPRTALSWQSKTSNRKKYLPIEIAASEVFQHSCSREAGLETSGSLRQCLMCPEMLRIGLRRNQFIKNTWSWLTFNFYVYNSWRCRWTRRQFASRHCFFLKVLRSAYTKREIWVGIVIECGWRFFSNSLTKQ